VKLLYPPIPLVRVYLNAGINGPPDCFLVHPQIMLTA
jgi:hypothetical protein